MKKISKYKIQLALTIFLVVINVVLWMLVQTTAYSIAQCRHVLLGRYSVGQATSLLMILLCCIPVLVLIWTKREKLKKRSLQLLALVISVGLAMFLFDLALRFIFPEPYVTTSKVFTRQPNSVSRGITHDVPKAAFSYPAIQEGYKDIPFVLTTDARGFRNTEALEQCDILAIGDSFTEGSGVSDNQVWPVLLSKQLGKNVYNLAMSGGNPFSYLDTLKEFGLKLKPKTVFVMLYEGNDFRRGKPKRRSGFSYRLRAYRKRSPVMRATKHMMINALGPVGVRRMENVPENHFLWPVAWLPLAIPQGNNANYYALEWGRLGYHWITSDEFKQSKGCKAAKDVLKELKSICRERQIRLIVLFAPDKPHVVLPITRANLSPKQVRAFLALKIKNLPPPDDCLNKLIEGMEVQESEMASFCKAESIEFVSFTNALRQGIASGKQLYFTYDQHWTPTGHEVVKDLIAKTLVK